VNVIRTGTSRSGGVLVGWDGMRQAAACPAAMPGAGVEAPTDTPLHPAPQAARGVRLQGLGSRLHGASVRVQCMTHAD
jgi:hypothetical protein